MALVTVALLGVSACSSASAPRTSASTTTRSTATTVRPGLPPSGDAALTAVVAPLLDAFDADVQRVEVQIEPVGAHAALLSLYARPRAGLSPDQYAAQIVPLAKAVIPVLLARYPGLDGVDLCQEAQHPPTDVDEPPPLTRVYVTRARMPEIHWATFDLRALRAQARGGDPAMQIYVDPRVSASATFRAAKPAT